MRRVMGRVKTPVTPAVRALRAAGVSFTDRLYDHEEKGGTAVSASLWLESGLMTILEGF
jgi:hypothetical protein